MMISCDKAATICDKAQYKEATFFEKLKLNLHVLICKTCAKHTKRNTKFTSLCNKANLHSLSEEEKLEINQKLQGKD